MGQGGREVTRLGKPLPTKLDNNATTVSTTNYESITLVTGSNTKLPKLVMILTWCPEKLSAF